jgi:hypothetical protein
MGTFALERQGTATNGQLWAYLMPTNGLPLRAGEDTKVVWRVDVVGSYGELHASALQADGTQGQLTFGPQGHGGSSWNRPGKEYGTSFLFPKSGCWTIHVTDGAMTGDLYLLVS